MWKLLKQKKLYTQLVLSSIITIFLPIAIITSVSYYRSTYHISHLVTELTQQIVVRTTSELDSIIDEVDWLTLQISQKEQVHNFLFSEVPDYYQRYLLDRWMLSERDIEEIFRRLHSTNSINFIGKNKNYVSRYGVSTSKADLIYNHLNPISDRIDYYNETLPNNGAWKLSFTNISTNPIITMGRKILPQNSWLPLGSIVIEIPAVLLYQIWEREDLQGGFIWIIDDTGNIIYHPDHTLIGMNGWNLIKPDGFKDDSGNFISKWDNKMQYFTYLNSKNTGWTVIATIPYANINQPVEAVRNIIFLTLFIVLPISLLLSYVFIKSITRPLIQLETGLTGVSDEKWQIIEGNIPDNEVGHLILVYNMMITKISNLIENKYKIELEQQANKLDKKKAEFQAMQMQINPHFLYNTLGAINTYALREDNADIQRMVSALSNMLRYAVQDPFEPVLLKSEIDHVKNFIIIQNYRFKTMPIIEINVDAYLQSNILRLTLQPIVENVFKHAFPYGINDTHTITISAYNTNESFIVKVSDNGIGFKNIQKDINNPMERGIGLSNVQKRIQMAYGPQYGIRMIDNPQGGTLVEMIFPSEHKDIFTWHKEE